MHDRTFVDHQKSVVRLEGVRALFQNNLIRRQMSKGKRNPKRVLKCQNAPANNFKQFIESSGIFLFFFGNNLLTSLRPQLSSVTQITRCCIPQFFPSKDQPPSLLKERGHCPSLAIKLFLQLLRNEMRIPFSCRGDPISCFFQVSLFCFVIF